MRRTNTTADALTAGMATIDLGDNLTAEIPVGKRAYTIDQTSGRTVKVWDYLNNREQMIYGDTGWRRIDVSSVAGSIRDIASPGTLDLRRVDSTVYARISGVKLAQGTGNGFIFPNNIPSGFRADALAKGAELLDIVGSSYSHRTFVIDNDIFWRGHDTGNGAVTLTRPTATAHSMYGHMQWGTLDPWPTTLPGTAVGVIPYQ